MVFFTVRQYLEGLRYTVMHSFHAAGGPQQACLINYGAKLNGQNNYSKVNNGPFRVYVAYV